MAPIVGYWDIRGIGQPVRLLLSYVEQPFVDKLYICGPPPELDKSQWLNEKQTLGLDFPNLPYYIDGDIKITQSLAILRHLGRKYGLVGKTEEEQIRIDIVEQQLSDLNSSFTSMSYNLSGGSFEQSKNDYVKNLPNHFSLLSKFLGDRKFFAGDYITYVDFYAYELLDKHNYLAKDLVQSFDNIKQYLLRFEQLPTIDKYMKSDKFMKWPLNNTAAKFGSKYDKH